MGAASRAAAARAAAAAAGAAGPRAGLRFGARAGVPCGARLSAAGSGTGLWEAPGSGTGLWEAPGSGAWGGSVPAAAGRTRALAGSGASGGEFGDADFHREADEVLEMMLETFEDLLESPVGEGLAGETDVTLAAGVLELKLGDKGTYVLNKQAPNRQVWMSSPVSGPLRYDYHTPSGNWVYTHDGSFLHLRLEEELEGLLGVPVEMPCAPP